MPRKSVTLTCPQCGNEFQKEFYESGTGATKRLAEKIEWAKDKGNLICTDCYKKERHEADKAKGLVAEIKVGLFAPNEISIIFSGDTYTHKDRLKALGCKWTDEYPSDLLSMRRPPKAWVYSTAVDKAEDACDVVIKSGAKFEIPSNLDIVIFQAFRKLNGGQF